MKNATLLQITQLSPQFIWNPGIAILIPHLKKFCQILYIFFREVHHCCVIIINNGAAKAQRKRPGIFLCR